MGTKQNNTYSEMILNTLDEMELNDSFNKENFIKKHRFIYDYFSDRSFCVLFCKAKQQLKGRKKLPDKDFKCIKGYITRIK